MVAYAKGLWIAAWGQDSPASSVVDQGPCDSLARDDDGRETAQLVGSVTAVAGGVLRGVPGDLLPFQVIHGIHFARLPHRKHCSSLRHETASVSRSHVQNRRSVTRVRLTEGNHLALSLTYLSLSVAQPSTQGNLRAARHLHRRSSMSASRRQIERATATTVTSITIGTNHGNAGPASGLLHSKRICRTGPAVDVIFPQPRTVAIQGPTGGASTRGGCVF